MNMIYQCINPNRAHSAVQDTMLCVGLAEMQDERVQTLGTAPQRNISAMQLPSASPALTQSCVLYDD